MARIRKVIPQYAEGDTLSLEERRRNELYGDLSGAFITGTTALANIGTFKENEIMQGIGQGAQFGSSIGSLFGPIGGVIGAGAGAIGGGIFGAAQKKRREEQEQEQREQMQRAAIDQFKNANTFGLDFGQSPITFSDGTSNPLEGYNPEYIPILGARPLSMEESMFFISQIENNKRAKEQFMISQLDNMIKSMVVSADKPSNKKKKKDDDDNRAFDFRDIDTSRSSNKAKKFFYRDGGDVNTIPAQLEKRNGIVEPILTPQNKLIDSNATTTHENQDDDNVTDMLEHGSMVYSAKRYNNNSVSMAAQVAKELGVDLDTKNINKLLEQHSKNVSPAEIANMARKYQSKSTVNSFDTDMLKQRSFQQITGIAGQINNLVSSSEPTVTKLPNLPVKAGNGLRVYAEGTDGCTGQFAELKWGSINGNGAWQVVKDCPDGCIHENPGPGTTLGQVVQAPCGKASAAPPAPASPGQPSTPPAKGPQSFPSKSECNECIDSVMNAGNYTLDQARSYCNTVGKCLPFARPLPPDPGGATPSDNIWDEICYEQCMNAMSGISPESADAVCKARCPKKPGGDSNQKNPGGDVNTNPPFIDPNNPPPDMQEFPKPSFDCEECLRHQKLLNKPTDVCDNVCGTTSPKSDPTNIPKRGISPDTLNFALANTANILSLMKARQQYMYPNVYTPFRKTDTIPISTADHILASAHPLMQDYMKQGPMGIAASIQAYNSALQGRNEYINQLQQINKNIDVQNTTEFNKNAVINTERFNEWGKDATALANAKLMAGPQTMAKAAENSQEYVATVYRRLYEKQLADYLQKAAGLPSGSFPAISLPQWMYSTQTTG